MVTVIFLTLVALTVYLMLGGILFLGSLKGLILSLVPGGLLLMGVLLIAWLMHD